jgi:myo-inositol-1(or 4)-monophosphatase
MTYIYSASQVDINSRLLRSIEEHASNLARQSGSILLEFFGKKLDIEYKSKEKCDPVTEADYKSQEFLINGIRSKFADHGILSEEMSKPQGLDRDFVWVIDPLDGTINFINGYPMFGISIGVLYKGIPVVGALFIPSPGVAGGQVFHAKLNGGAFADGKPLRVYSGADLDKKGLVSIPAQFHGYFRVGRKINDKLANLRTTGSITYEIALVASGVLQYSAFSSPKIWDIAAGVVILNEAGGAALRRTYQNNWEPLESFLTPTGCYKEGDFEKWQGSILMGNSQIITMVAKDLIPRRKLAAFLRSLRIR